MRRSMSMPMGVSSSTTMEQEQQQQQQAAVLLLASTSSSSTSSSITKMSNPMMGAVPSKATCGTIATNEYPVWIHTGKIKIPHVARPSSSVITKTTKQRSMINKVPSRRRMVVSSTTNRDDDDVRSITTTTSTSNNNNTSSLVAPVSGSRPTTPTGSRHRRMVFLEHLNNNNNNNTSSRNHNNNPIDSNHNSSNNNNNNIMLQHGNRSAHARMVPMTDVITTTSINNNNNNNSIRNGKNRSAHVRTVPMVTTTPTMDDGNNNNNSIRSRSRPTTPIRRTVDGPEGHSYNDSSTTPSRRVFPTSHGPSTTNRVTPAVVDSSNNNNNNNNNTVKSRSITPTRRIGVVPHATPVNSNNALLIPTMGVDGTTETECTDVDEDLSSSSDSSNLQQQQPQQQQNEYEWKQAWLILPPSVSAPSQQQEQEQLEKSAKDDESPSSTETRTAINNNASNNNKLDDKITLRLENSNILLKIPRSKLHHDVVLDNRYDIKSSEQQSLSDLVALEYFHEPAVVHCLQDRFEQGLVYTATGPVLLAVNPFRSLPDLYSEQVMMQYWQRAEHTSPSHRKQQQQHQTDTQQQGKSLPPHVYGIADESFRSMMRGMEWRYRHSSQYPESNKNNNNNNMNKTQRLKLDQSILVSGESGAGKTVTTKHLMKYLAALSQRAAILAQSTKGNKKSIPSPKKQQFHHTAVTTIRGSPRSVVPVVPMETSSTTCTESKNNNNMTTTTTTEVVHETSKDIHSIENQVLQSNPILESFGNARTIRNDNSSRFGKLIDMQFSRTGRLLGTSIDTYLLEKVRLVRSGPGERNFHIFYELLAAMQDTTTITDHDEQRTALYLSSSAASKPTDFIMLCRTGTYDRRDGVSDASMYRALRRALNAVGFTKQQQHDLFGTVAAILHAGNVTLYEDENGEAVLARDHPHLEPACALLGINPNALNEALCYYSISARGEILRRRQTVSNAEKGLDALLKATYGALFTFLVQTINGSIACHETTTKNQSQVEASIRVLDIFGFESFESNSFEQLCINYCNESLQQQFNTFMLKNGQADIVSQGLDWDFIQFPENQDVLDLIDEKHIGVMSILDDMCRAPGSTDSGFAQQVHKQCCERSRFEAKAGSMEFTIHHYAGPVEYTATGFVEKNRDDLPRETFDLLMSSTNPFIHKLAEILASDGKTSASASSKVTTSSTSLSVSSRKQELQTGMSRPTVGGFFRQQVQDLRSKIDSTSPHYVRCIKPNAELVPYKYDIPMVAQQLRCGGIIQAVSITRNGFSLNQTFEDFVDRYNILMQLQCASDGFRRIKSGSNKVTKEQCEVLVNWLLQKLDQLDLKTSNKKKNEHLPELLRTKENMTESNLLEIGKTKVLLKHTAFEALEGMLGAVQAKYATRINTISRRYLARKLFFAEREEFYKELKHDGLTFEEWFRLNRAMYYKPKSQSSSLRVTDIVSLRKEMFQRQAGKSARAIHKGGIRASELSSSDVVTRRVQLFRKAQSYSPPPPSSRASTSRAAGLPVATTSVRQKREAVLKGLQKAKPVRNEHIQTDAASKRQFRTIPASLNDSSSTIVMTQTSTTSNGGNSSDFNDEDSKITRQNTSETELTYRSDCSL